MTSCTSNTKASSNHFPMHHTHGHLLAKKTLIQDHESYPLIDLPFPYQPVQFKTPFACFSIHHIISMLYNSLNPITHKMFPYVIHYLASPIQTVYTWKKIFPTLIRLNSFQGKFQELFNPFLIHMTHLTCIYPTSIHLIAL